MGRGRNIENLWPSFSHKISKSNCTKFGNFSAIRSLDQFLRRSEEYSL